MNRSLLLAGMLIVSSGCAEPELSAEARQAIEAQAEALARTLAEETSAATAGVVVKLKFDENVDLDLYVTDPLLETVYFARHESRTGGVIGADVRCETIGPRVEEIRFPNPWPGRYRVGVDFPARCDGSSTRAPAPFALTVSANGEVHETHGLVNLKYFEVVVLEFEIGETPDDQGDS